MLYESANLKLLRLGYISEINRANFCGKTTLNSLEIINPKLEDASVADHHQYTKFYLVIREELYRTLVFSQRFLYQNFHRIINPLALRLPLVSPSLRLGLDFFAKLPRSRLHQR